MPRTGPGLTSSPYPDAAPLHHNGATVICADCHIMHASQTHPYGATPGPGEDVPYPGTANPKLLEAADPVDLCLACHDGQTFAPDVVGLDANGLANRSRGFFAAPETPNASGHDLGLFADPAATGMARYEAANVSYGSLNTNALREPTNICLDCHHVFSGGSYIDPDGSGIHSRHPAYDSERGSTNSIDQGQGDGGSNPAHWQGGAGSGFYTTPRVRWVVSGATDNAAGRVVDPHTNGVFCLTCHKAHGSDQAFGVTWQLDQGYSAPGCDQCHLIANAPGPPSGP